jgi:hypothetical protein
MPFPFFKFPITYSDLSAPTTFIGDRNLIMLSSSLFLPVPLIGEIVSKSLFEFNLNPFFTVYYGV